jgi:hypothetical protein
MSKFEPNIKEHLNHPIAIAASQFLDFPAIPKGCTTLAQPFKVGFEIWNCISPEGTTEKVRSRRVCTKTEILPFSLFGLRACFGFRISGFEFPGNGVLL